MSNFGYVALIFFRNEFVLSITVGPIGYTHFLLARRYPESFFLLFSRQKNVSCALIGWHRQIHLFPIPDSDTVCVFDSFSILITEVIYIYILLCFVFYFTKYSFLRLVIRFGSCCTEKKTVFELSIFVTLVLRIEVKCCLTLFTVFLDLI